MKYNLCLFLFASFFACAHNNCYGQKNMTNPGGGVFFYNKVEKYKYIDSIQRYEFVDSIKISKAISIDPVKIYIESFIEGESYSLKILDYYFNDSSKLHTYVCKSKDTTYTFLTTIFYDQSILVFNDMKLVFFKTPVPHKQTEIIFIPIPNKQTGNPDSIVYLDLSLDRKPRYKNSQTYELSLQNFQQDLEAQIMLNCDTTNKSEVFLVFTLTKEGRIFQASIKGGSPGKLEACIISTIEAMSGWTPGQIRGEMVSTKCFISLFQEAERAQ